MQIKQQESYEITANEVMEEPLLPLLRDYFVAHVKMEEQGIIVEFLNGQIFQVTIS